MDSQNLVKAFLIWTHRYAHREFEKDLQPFLEGSFRAPPPLGWIRQAREAQLLSMETVARRAGITRAAWKKWEENENKGGLSLASLRKAAQALDCELVYGLRPKSGKSFSAQLWNELSKPALELYKRRTRSQKINPLVLANIVNRLLTDPKFRKKKGWSRNQPR